MGRSRVGHATQQGTASKIAALFPVSYEGSRARFRKNLDRLQQYWPEARLAEHRLSYEEGLTIDWIEAEATEKLEKLIIVTTGQHGIEAYVGSAMMQVFIDEFVHRLHPETTGLLLVHAINPWGMKYRRRVNKANVDLNRNFIWEADSRLPWNEREVPFANPDYAKLSALFNPPGVVRGLLRSRVRFLYRLAWNARKFGIQRLQNALLAGQYQEPEGIYYGGTGLQEETRLLMRLYREKIERYRQLLLMDMHTGYGASHQMSLVNSILEPRQPGSLARQFEYPVVISSDDAQFYSISGDMIDYTYQLVSEEFPDKGLYATTFEFGTLGNSLWAGVRSLMAIVLENQLYRFGAASSNEKEEVERAFEALFIPSEFRWRSSAVADARRAFEGILQAEGFFSTHNDDEPDS
jgi:hypothetical protein